MRNTEWKVINKTSGLLSFVQEFIYIVRLDKKNNTTLRKYCQGKYHTTTSRNAVEYDLYTFYPNQTYIKERGYR